jgi:hypothetical protein
MSSGSKDELHVKEEARTSFMSKKRAENSEELSLIKQRGLAIIYEKKLHLSKSSSDSKKKGPTASIIPSMAKIGTIIEDIAVTQSQDPMEGRDEPPVRKTYTRPHTFKDILLNYSHSRNPRCAPARTHGQIQAPRETPN